MIVAGPSATETVRMEAAAQAGEIAVSAATALALPASVLGAPLDGGYLLASAPPANEHRRALPALDELPLDRCVPRPICEHISAGVAEPEHRQAAVAFLRMSGLDQLVRAEGVTAAARAVGEVVDAVQRAAAEHDVCFLESDVDADGARIVLVAGAPRVSENDVERLAPRPTTWKAIPRTCDRSARTRGPFE